MSLKYIADVHISSLTVKALQDKGYSIERVTNYLAATATDLEIIEFALQKQAVIITQDLDFSALVAQSGRAKPSVVTLRIGNVKPAVTTSILIQVLPRIEDELQEGAIVSVTEENYRIRKLPIQTD